jgi:hypothetical protein
VSKLPALGPGPASAAIAPLEDSLKVSGVQTFLRGH